VEYGGRRILFDAGNDGDIFARNVRALKVDLRHLDFAVISHRHGDHTGGLGYLLRVNPKVTIYAPYERFGLSAARCRRRSSVPIPRCRRGCATSAAPFRRSSRARASGARISSGGLLTEVAPGVALVSTVSRTPGTLELHELSLVLRTPEGLVVIVGVRTRASETILEATRAYGDHVHEIFGGLHLVSTADPEIERIASSLRDHWRLDLIAPGHCTGEPAFDALSRAFGDRYVYAGLGTVVALH